MEFENLEKKLQRAREQVPLIMSFFGQTAKGKSYIINWFLQVGTSMSEPRSGPLPSTGVGTTTGVPTFPILIQNAEDGVIGVWLEYCNKNGEAVEQYTEYWIPRQQMDAIRAEAEREPFYQKVSFLPHLLFLHAKTLIS